MKVFISWSGELARQVANALRDWLPQVLHPVQAWLATDDPAPGQPWSEEIKDLHAETSVVLVCCTRENLASSNLNDEIAALTAARRLVIPVCVDVGVGELRGQIAGLSAVSLDAAGVGHLVRTLNSQLSEPVPARQLDAVLLLWIPELLDIALKLQTRDTIAGNTISVNRPLKSYMESSTADAAIARLVKEMRRLGDRIDQLQDPTTALGTREASGSATPQPSAKPRVFIGSSTEGLEIAESIQAGLDYVAECTVWNQADFRPSQTTIESLVEMSVAFDFAVIVMTADDTLIKRGNTTIAPRDNLVFELGLFTGSLGRGKAFLVKCRDEKIELPSDLQGVTTIDYGRRADENLKAALAPVCLRMKEVMGVR
jgi:predicted nucleotide-binding protein